MLIMGIESSCDETAASIVKDGVEVLSNVVISQIKSHAKYGGVVPEVASRKHTENISYVLDKCFSDAGITYKDLDAVAVSHQPGLFGALIVGVTAAKTISYVADVPFIGVNHVLGHVYGNYLSDKKPEFPYISLIVSGGHTFIAKVTGHYDYEIIGRTKDDAAGEAYDKVARLMGLGYPGGPIVDSLAVEGDPSKFVFPRALDGVGYDFSFSGVKTAVINRVHDLTDDPFTLSKETVCDICAGFQDSVVDILVRKTIAAAKEFGMDKVLLAGGVSANKGLRKRFEEVTSKEGYDLYIPEFKYCTDNAAMIASAGYFKYKNGETDNLDLKINPNFSVL